MFFLNKKKPKWSLLTFFFICLFIYLFSVVSVNLHVKHTFPWSLRFTSVTGNPAVVVSSCCTSTVYAPSRSHVLWLCLLTVYSCWALTSQQFLKIFSLTIKWLLYAILLYIRWSHHLLFSIAITNYFLI